MHYAMLLFPGFEALDVFGPLEVLNVLSERTQIHLSLLSTTIDPVSTKSPDPAAHRIGSVCAQQLIPTGTFADTLTAVRTGHTAIDVLLVPGGAGTRFPEIINPVVDFVRDIYPSVTHVMSICNGAGVLARAGVLDGRQATTNKMLWTPTTALRSEVKWVKEARWVRDGDVWTASGVTAGIDVALAFVREIHGGNMAGDIAREIEYVWDEEDDGKRDPFAAAAV